MTPAWWMSNPEVFAETANLMIAPTTTSTMPNDIRPMPVPLFMALSVGRPINWFKDPGADPLASAVAADLADHVGTLQECRGVLIEGTEGATQRSDKLASERPRSPAPAELMRR